ncbi:MAG: hypothetical protein AAGF87_09470 [Bacteroidota bacterium]
MIKSRFVLLCLILAPVSLLAQDPSALFHQTFDLEDFNGIKLEAHTNDSIRVEKWVGNQLMIETNIKMLNGRRSLLDHYLEKGRWALDTTINGDQLHFAAHSPVRNVLTTNQIEIVEEVNIVFYVPETFESTTLHVWARKEE